MAFDGDVFSVHLVAFDVLCLYGFEGACPDVQGDLFALYGVVVYVCKYGWGEM